MKVSESFWLATTSGFPVPFHESFWLATAAAAPIIALSAMVMLPEWTIRHNLAVSAAVDAEIEAESSGFTDTRHAKLSLLASRIRVQAMMIIVVQAFVLGQSLFSLLNQRNQGDPWLTISLTVGGLLCLAWASMRAGTFQTKWTKLHGRKSPGGTA